MKSVCIALALASALLATFRVPATATSSDGTIVFQNHGDVWLADSDGTNQRFLAGQPRYADQGISWSPDGKHVVYSGLGNGGQAIWMVNADGTDAHIIIDTPHYDLTLRSHQTADGWPSKAKEGRATGLIPRSGSREQTDPI
jgi:hypothetical protein